jgi:hypothetical protein
MKSFTKSHQTQGNLIHSVGSMKETADVDASNNVWGKEMPLSR